jgi:hypothetical protein
MSARFIDRSVLDSNLRTAGARMPAMSYAAMDAVAGRTSPYR